MCFCNVCVCVVVGVVFFVVWVVCFLWWGCGFFRYWCVFCGGVVLFVVSVVCFCGGVVVFCGGVVCIVLCGYGFCGVGLCVFVVKRGCFVGWLGVLLVCVFLVGVLCSLWWAEQSKQNK